MTTKDGGPAFPVNELHQYSGEVIAQHLGMTLRDYFAAKAMQGHIASPEGESWFSVKDMDSDAEFCYQIADAMLKAREA